MGRIPESTCMDIGHRRSLYNATAYLHFHRYKIRHNKPRTVDDAYIRGPEQRLEMLGLCPGIA